MRGSTLEQLDGLLEESLGALLVQRAARERAYKRALAELEENGERSPAGAFVLLGYATDLLVGHAVELAAHHADLAILSERLEDSGLIPRVPLAASVLRAPELLELPSAVAVEVALGLLAGFTGAKTASLWTLDPNRELKHLAHAGEFDPAAAPIRRLARGLLGESGKSERNRTMAGVAIERGHRPAAAVVVRGTTTAAVPRRLVLASLVPMLAAMLERDELLDRSHQSDEAIVASAERRLSRLRFDLHDGPQQDVVLLADDVRLLRSQLEGLVDGRRDKARVLGRLDDLQARLVAIDGDLRRISAFVQSPFLQSEGLPAALAKITDEFAARTGIDPEVRLEGDMGELTDSQQITVLGLVREALSNIREHSQAQHVTISLLAGGEGVEATVTDDGRGFDPETTLVRAARGGHIGLVGMHQRVQMLGGRTVIESRPGGPTVISARLPRYVPATTRRQAPIEPQPPIVVRPAIKRGRARSRAHT